MPFKGSQATTHTPGKECGWGGGGCAIQLIQGAPGFVEPFPELWFVLADKRWARAASLTMKSRLLETSC